VRILKVSILLALIFKSSLGFGAITQLIGSSSCCQVEIEDECSTSGDEEKETKKCCGSNCDCLCCGVVFTLDKSKELNLEEPHPIILTQPAFSFTYFHNFNLAIWQPPRLI